MLACWRAPWTGHAWCRPASEPLICCSRFGLVPACVCVLIRVCALWALCGRRISVYAGVYAGERTLTHTHTCDLCKFAGVGYCTEYGRKTNAINKVSLRSVRALIGRYGRYCTSFPISRRMETLHTSKHDYKISIFKYSPIQMANDRSSGAGLRARARAYGTNSICISINKHHIFDSAHL